MTGLQQHSTTKCGLDESGRFLSGSQHPDWKDLLEPELENARFGSWTIVSRQIQRRGRHICANVRCDCGTEDWKVLDNLRRGLSTCCTSCRSKNRHRKAGHMLVETAAERLLQRRVESIFQRCNNHNDRNFRNYGGRGIQCLFPTKRELFEHLLSLHPAEDWLGYEIDRIDNNKHYAPGNLRRATQAVNRQNRRRTRWVYYKGQQVVQAHLWHLIKTDYPEFEFSQGKVLTLLKQDVPPDKIPQYERVGKRVSTTSRTPDPAIVSLYRDV
jgi:hypothetical protein